jgi:hypothetical protein
MTPLVLRSFTGVSSPVVRAQLVRRNSREITIEIHALMELAWKPESFDVVLVAGGELTGRVDMSRTTRAGTLAPGQIARTTIVLDAQIVLVRHALVVQ